MDGHAVAYSQSYAPTRIFKCTNWQRVRESKNYSIAARGPEISRLDWWLVKGPTTEIESVNSSLTERLVGPTLGKIKRSSPS